MPGKSEQQGEVKIDGVSVDISGEKGERVSIGPGGIHVRDAESEVSVSWSGIRVRDKDTRLNISFWKPLLGCGVALLALAALMTLVIVVIVRLMIK